MVSRAISLVRKDDRRFNGAQRAVCDLAVDLGAVRRLWIHCWHDRTMRSRVRSTRKKPEVFKWTKCMEDFVHGQLGYSLGTFPPTCLCIATAIAAAETTS